MKQYYKLIF